MARTYAALIWSGARPTPRFLQQAGAKLTVPRAPIAAAASTDEMVLADGRLGVRLQPQNSQALEELWAGVSTLVLDCDGVLWRGSTLMPGTVEALQHFRALGKRLLFLTNNSSKSRRQYLAKFAALGIQAAPEEVVPTSYAAAAYLQSVGFDGRAFVIGNEGLAEELSDAGIDHVTWAQLSASGDGDGTAALHQGWTAERFAALRLDAAIGAVVVGWDPTFSYASLCFASACLRELPGCLFVATNLDSADHMGNGRMMPGTGCSVRAVEAAAGRPAFNVGKGGSWLLPFLCDKYGVRPEEACIVGDRLDTDIALGRSGGLRTVLPLTGVTTAAEAEAAAELSKPHFVVADLAVLAGIQT